MDGEGMPLYRCYQCLDGGCEFCPRVDDDVEPWPAELFQDYTDAELYQLITDGMAHLRSRNRRLEQLERAWSL